MTRARLLSSMALLLLASSSAHADLPKRNTPDYDGRQEPTTTGEVLLWVPRVVLSPLYVVSEYVVRRPLGFVLSAAERAELPDLLYSFFTFGPDRNAGILPIAFIDFGFDPSVGVYAFWNDAFAERHDLRLRASTWGEDWLAASFTERYAFDDDNRVELLATAVHRPDYIYFGTGPRTVESDVSRYGADRLEIEALLDHGFWRASHVTYEVGARSMNFYDGAYDEDPTLRAQVAAGRFALPDGYVEGYTLLFNRLSIALDSRRPRPASGSGMRIVGSVEHQTSLRDANDAGTLRYGGSVGGFLDLNDQGRVVSLSVSTFFTDPLGDSRIPFTELAAIGGEESLRGFASGRLRGRSSAIANLRYRWPIWIWLDGSIQIGAGNVFGEHLAGIAPSLMRLSSAVGIESVGSPDSSFELLVGMGTETFEQNLAVSSVRIAFGTNHGF